MNPSTHKAITVGVDVGKQSLDIYIRPTGEAFQVENTPSGIASAIARCRTAQPDRVVVEATGRLEAAFTEAAHRAGLPLTIANPTQVRRFAQAIGRQAKTDRLDARDIAHFGEALQPPLTPAKDKNNRLISDLLARRAACAGTSSSSPRRSIASTRRWTKPRRKSLSGQRRKTY